MCQNNQAMQNDSSSDDVSDEDTQMVLDDFSDDDNSLRLQELKRVYAVYPRIPSSTSMVSVIWELGVNIHPGVIIPGHFSYSSWNSMDILITSQQKLGIT